MTKEQKDNNLVEIIEEFQNGVLVSRRINGKKVVIPEIEKNFVKFNRISLSFNKVKSIFGEYKLEK